MPVLVSIFRTRVVVTVLDLRYLEDRRNFKWYHLVYRKLAYYPSAILAHHIITISDFTRATVMERWNLPKERITTVLLGVGGSFRPTSPAAVDEAEILTAHGVHGRFVLSAANSPHKNPELVVRAFATLAPDLHADWTLVLLGTRADQPYMPRLAELVSDLGLKGRVIFTGHVPDEHVPLFYRSAKVYVTLSDYEGFGLTVLEAMASGVPVVASNVAALPEVVGNAGILVDAHDISAVALAIKSAATDDCVRERLVQRGLARAREFSWSLTARRTLEVYGRIGLERARSVAQG
jgi:glycosyltransferase involved in cell wall biosynthesis